MMMWAWAAGEMRPVIDETNANPTIGKAINGGYDFLEAKCNPCRRMPLVAQRKLRRPADTPILKLEAALFCEPSGARRKRAHILGLTYARPIQSRRS